MPSAVTTAAVGPVATITLTRPERRNALTVELMSELRAALAEADDDPTVGAIVLTGHDPAFCAGLDLDEVGRDGGLVTRAGTAPWEPTRKPLVCAVNGAAVTGGLELVLHCDVVVASERARFGDTHARVGVLPGWGLTVLLPRRIGLARALEMSLTSRFVDAEEAHAWGLVDHVVPHAEVVPEAVRLAEAMTGTDPATSQALLAAYRSADAARGTAAGLQDANRESASWQRGFDPGEVDRRRPTIVEGGRRQIR